MNFFIYFFLLATCAEASSASASASAGLPKKEKDTNPKTITINGVERKIVDISRIPTEGPQRIRRLSGIKGDGDSPIISPYQHILDAKINRKKAAVAKNYTEEEIQKFNDKLERALKAKDEIDNK